MKKILLLSFALSMLAFAPHTVRASFVNSEAMAAKLISLTNQEREARGLNSLKENSQLTQAAFAKANDMLAQGYFSHTSPGNKAFYRWVDSTGYEYSAVAENLAVNLNMISAEEMVKSWLNSPGHRANLLSGTYTEMGMGVSHGSYLGQEAVFAVHVFAAPKNKIAAALPNSAPATAIIEKKTAPLKTQPFKNIDVLGESISAEITSPLIAAEGKGPENINILSTFPVTVEPEPVETPAQKSWLKKLIEFFLTR